jgi:hypothetical protein
VAVYFNESQEGKGWRNMNKNVQKLAFVLLLFFIAGTVGVFALSWEEREQISLLGWRAGYNYASSNPKATLPSQYSSVVDSAERRAGIAGAEVALKKGAFYEGFIGGFNWQRAGN